MSDDPRFGASPGDRAIDAAWRRASAEEPSAHADAAILAAARAGRGRRPHWRTMAAAAAVAALALLLVPRTERQAERGDLQFQAPMESPPADAPPTAIEAAPTAVAPPRQEAASRESTAPTAMMPPAAPQPAGPSAASGSVLLEAELSAQTAAPGLATAPSRAVTAATTDGSANRSSAREWIDRIASLRASGDSAAAATALQEFRRAFPDADSQLPPELRAWAAAVPQQP